MKNKSEEENMASRGMKIADMHCDTISELLKRRRAGRECGLEVNDCHVDIEKLKKGGYCLQNFALFVDKEACENPWQEVLALLELYQEEMQKNRMIAPVLCYDDILRNRQEGKLSAVLTVEEGAVCQGEIEKLHILYHKGVRMLTLTWNYPNELGFPNLDREAGRIAWEKVRQLREWRVQKEQQTEGETYVQRQKEVQNILDAYLNHGDSEKGLTRRGREFVEEMEALGMIVDVSHLSDKGFYDVADMARKPFVASHSNARAVCPCARNLTDDMIRRLAEKGGVMGLNYCADFLRQPVAGAGNPGTVADIVRHAKHIVAIGGMECLGLGSDFDGIDTHEELSDAGNMPLLAETLLAGGFTGSQVDRILGENVLRLYREHMG